MGNLVMLTKMSRRRTSLPSFFLALVACFYLSQPIETFRFPGYPGFPDDVEKQGECKDFTRGECQEKTIPIKMEFNVASQEACQKHCHDHNRGIGQVIGAMMDMKKCGFFIYDTKYRECALHGYNIHEHDWSCKVVGGPTLPSVDKCDNSLNEDCSNMLGIDCNYEDYIQQLRYIHTPESCQRECSHHYRCKFFVHNQVRRICSLYGSTSKTCRYIRGPPITKLQGCPSHLATSTKCPRNYPYAFKNGAHCCSTNEENPRGGSYEEIVSGTCDGVGFDIMSTCCKNYDSIKCPGDSCIDNKEG